MSVRPLGFSPRTSVITKFDFIWLLTSGQMHRWEVFEGSWQTSGGQGLRYGASGKTTGHQGDAGENCSTSRWSYSFLAIPPSGVCLSLRAVWLIKQHPITSPSLTRVTGWDIEAWNVIIFLLHLIAILTSSPCVCDKLQALNLATHYLFLGLLLRV